MKTKKHYQLLISVGLALFFFACSSSPQVSRETSYYDSPQLQGKTTSLVDVSFQMGGGSSDGNPEIPVAEWSIISIQIDRLTLKQSSGEKILVSGKKTDINFKRGSKAALTAKIPADVEFSEIAFDLSVSSTDALTSLPFRAEGTLRSGERFTINLDIGLLAFKGLSGSLKWTAANRKSVVVYLDAAALAKSLPWGEFQPTNGKIVIDSGILPTMYETLAYNIFSSLALYSDEDGDGTLKDAELEARNKIGGESGLIDVGCQRCDDANNCTTDFCIGDSWCVLTNFLADGIVCGVDNAGTCSLGKCSVNGGDYDEIDLERGGFPVPQIVKVTDTGKGSELFLTNDAGNACGKTTQASPLDRIIIDASNSSSPDGHSPLNYFWEIIEKPDYAVDAAIICRACTFGDSTSIEKRWSDESSPKLLLPLMGTYKLRVAVKDSLGVASSDAENDVSCKYAYLTIEVKTPKKLYIQLAWDKGDDVDFDLFLARYRVNGTMGVSPNNDYLQAPALTMPSTCSHDADCCPAQNGGLCTGLTCSGGSCVTQCSDDAYCKKAHPGYTCNGVICWDNNLRWMCRDELDVKDGDCKGKGYCSTRIVSGEAKKFCTSYSFAQENDSCGFNNRNPEWGNLASADDNPSLDIDDVNGFGPELITMTDPGSASAKYRVMVRFYADPNAQVSAENPVKAFVNIYLNGTACQSKSVWTPFKETLTYWKAADINWKGDATTCDDITILPLNPSPSAVITDLNYAEAALNAQCLDPQNAACDYANPFKTAVGGVFNPCDASNQRSIWCDAASSADCCYKTNSCSCPQ